MIPITDMHCHVLPGVDDGSKSMEESIQCLKTAAEQGIQSMIVTPHFHPGRYKVDAQNVLETLERLREACRDNEIPITLYPGQECYWYSELIQELDKGNALTMNNGKYVLVEFEPGTLYSMIYGAVRDLFSAGYMVIIAHFERYQCLQGRRDRLDELKGCGALLQMNFDRLIKKDTLFSKNPWRKLVKDEYVDFLGSDTHGVDFRPLHVDQVRTWIEKELDPELADRILVQNIRLLL